MKKIYTIHCNSNRYIPVMEKKEAIDETPAIAVK
jgi:hypothetical protein